MNATARVALANVRLVFISLVYDMDWNGQGQARASVEASILTDTQGVAVTRNGMFGLLSYGDGSFPELWQLRDSKDRVRLELCRVYAPATTGSSDQKKAMAPRVVGKAHFGSAQRRPFYSAIC